MTRVPESDEPLYLASPVGKVALSGYDPDFWVSLTFTEACPLASVVAVAVWAPRTKFTFLPTTGWPYLSTRSAVSVTTLPGLDESGPVYPSVVSRLVTWTM